MKFDLIKEYHELKDNGVKIINLGIGEVGFESPSEIRGVSSKRCFSDKICYTSEKGMRALREKLANYVNTKFGCKCTYENVLVTNGARQALFDVFFSILETNDEVIVIRPGWSGYEDIVKSLGGKIKPVMLQKANEFFISAEKVISEISDKTKAIIINTPANPFGNNVKKNELKKVIEASHMHDIKLILDVVYQDCGLCNELLELNDFSLEQLRNVILVDSFSKRYAMSGWRIGYLIATKELVEKAAMTQKLVTNNVNTLSQYALMTEFDDEKYLLKRRKALISNYEWLQRFYASHNYIKELNDSKNIYYTCIKLRGISGHEYIMFAEKLLREFNVLVAFFEFENDYFLRLSFACPTKTLMEGLECIDRCYNTMHKGRLMEGEICTEKK